MQSPHDANLGRAVRDSVRDRCGVEVRLIAVYRFGSTVGGVTHPGSDVDLAVLADRPLDPVGVFDATHVIAVRRLGIAKDGRHAFDLLAEAKVIPPARAERLKRMVGFRNVAVHEYHRLDRAIVGSIIRERLGDFTEFATAIVAA